MKIAVLSTYINNYLEPASFKIRYNTAKSFAEHGHEVIFISPSKSSFSVSCSKLSENFTFFETFGIFPCRLRVGGFSICDAIFKTILILKSKVDAVYVIDGHRPAQFLPSFLSKLFKNTIIIDECWEWFGKGGFADNRKGIVGNLIGIYDILFEKTLRSHYDHLILISNGLKKAFGNKNVSVLHGGTQNQLLKNYDKSHARKILGLGQDKFFIGMSNITPSDQNDNDIFFEAFHKLANEHDDLYLIATGASEEYIEAISQKFLLQGKIIFPGWIDFKKYNLFLSACDIFVLPLVNNLKNSSRWPNKIGDYFCVSRPTITNPTGDIKTIFEKHKVGFLCEEKVESFYEIIKKVMSQKSDLNNLACDCISLSKNELSFDSRVQKILGLISNLLKSKN